VVNVVLDFYARFIFDDTKVAFDKPKDSFDDAKASFVKPKGASDETKVSFDN
jgi:hypothetical protein